MTAPVTPWVQVGGTSLAAALLGGALCHRRPGPSRRGRPQPLDESESNSDRVFSLPTGDFHDITTRRGQRHVPMQVRGFMTWVTGLGTPEANVLVSDLAS